MIGTTLLHYRITEKLGVGGQGTVYKAQDSVLERPVVVKILAPELTLKVSNLKRFAREARLASALDHPNICTIYGLHEVGDLHFIVMQYVEGKNVRQLVAGRPLALSSALSIALQVTDALVAAHARGIIHRDIKAGNVMVTETGLVKVLDFGLAKLLDEGGDPRDAHLTEMGVPYGTATYAAPEQARGGIVDHRADIFSTGVLLYEMLTGMWPFRGKNTVEVRYAVLHDTPQSLAKARPDAPPRLQQIIDRALAKEPAARYQKIAEMREDLRGVMREMGAESNAIHLTDSLSPVVPRHEPSRFGRTFRRWFRSLSGTEAAPTSLPPAARTPAVQSATQPPLTREEEMREAALTTSTGDTALKTVAILPFRNLSGDREASFYEFSLADAVITELARLRSLVVRPSSVIAKYQGQQRDPLEIGRELNASAVLSASYLRVGERLRVTAQLLDVTSGEILWSDRIDATEKDIIALQDTIAHRIVDGMSLELSTDEQVDIAHHTTSNAAAYEEYLRGRDRFGHFIFRTLAPEDCDAAIAHFKRAIELDPDFALAHSGLGACHANRVFKGFGGNEDYELAEASFNRAIELDPDIGEARMLMVFILLARDEKEKARAEVARLRRKSPNEPAVYFVKGSIHRLDGEYDEALRSFARLAQLDPSARVVAHYNRARIFLYEKRYDEAKHELDQASAVEPDHPLVRTFRAVLFYRQGQYVAAAETLREVLERHPKMDGIRPLLAVALSKQGEHEAARAELTEAVRESADADHDIAYWLASACAVENDTDQAFYWLERAISLGNENRQWFEANPDWAALRNDPRFIELMNRIATAHTRMSTEAG